MALPNTAIRLYPEALRSLAFGSISGTYAKLGTALTNPSRILYFFNTTDVTVTFSFDGSTDHFIIPTESGFVLDVSSNRSEQSGIIFVAQNTQIYVKGSPGSGSVYLTSFYGAD